MEILKKIRRGLIKIVKPILSEGLRITYKCLYKFVKVDEKMVIFISFHGRGYSDNPRAIYQEMLKDERFKDFKFIWFIKKGSMKSVCIPGAKIVRYFSPKYFYYLSKAKFWVINCKMPMYIRKKEEQVYLQTWHGTPLKRLAHDIEFAEDTTFYRSEMSYEKMVHTYDVDVEKYNYMISPNKFCTEVFQTSFRINRERLIETGYPRNDFITNASEEDILQIKNKFNIPTDKKIVLYAPTWRDNSYVAAGYTFELKADFHKWKEILGDEYIVVFKPHYLIINKYEDDTSLEGFLYSIPASAEINELYVISDILITDYSSVFFDYAVLNRPIYFYMYDIEEYKDQLRGFYLDIYSELPGKIYDEEEKLLNDISNNVYDYSHLSKFNERFSHAQDGQCGKKVLDILAKHI